jgi:hypothetical protein
MFDFQAIVSLFLLSLLSSFEGKDAQDEQEQDDQAAQCKYQPDQGWLLSGSPTHIHKKHNRHKQASCCDGLPAGNVSRALAIKCESLMPLAGR